MNNSSHFSEKAWVAVGYEANWEKGLENGIWGLRPKLKNHWDRIQLKLKIMLFSQLRNNFHKTKEPRWLRRLLGKMNSIFGSLSSIFPGMETVNEFKGCLEQIVKMRK